MDNVNEGLVAMRSLYPPWSLVETIVSTMRRSGALPRMVFSSENDACIWRKGERTNMHLQTTIESIDQSIGPGDAWKGPLDASVAELLEDRMQQVLALAITRTCQAWHKNVIHDLSAWHKKVMPSVDVCFTAMMRNIEIRRWHRLCPTEPWKNMRSVSPRRLIRQVSYVHLVAPPVQKGHLDRASSTNSANGPHGIATVTRNPM